MTETTWTKMSGAVARESRVTVATVTRYSNKGLIPSRRASNGVRLFPDNAAKLVRKVYAERMANRGRTLA